MPGSTPLQGFVYPLASDAPGSLATTFATLAGQLDAKGASWDTDAARVAANAFVKVSASSVIDTNPVQFTTVEINRSTPTDLTVFNGIICGAGYWVVGMSVSYPNKSAGAQMTVGFNYATADATRQPDMPDFLMRDAFGQAIGGLPGPPLPLSILNQQQGVIDLALFAVQSNVSVNITTGLARTLNYVELWAFKLGDF